MTAFTAVERIVSKDGEIECRTAILTGGPAYTYTPSNSTGGVIKVCSCYDTSTANDSVTASVSSGVITVDAAGADTTEYSITYVLYR